jgi:hypothetical protein
MTSMVFGDSTLESLIKGQCTLRPNFTLGVKAGKGNFFNLLFYYGHELVG